MLGILTSLLPVQTREEEAQTYALHMYYMCTYITWHTLLSLEASQFINTVCRYLMTLD